MANARLIHPQAGRDAKVSALSDFEYRVWTQYLSSADDFGVMVAEAVVIQAGNSALKNRPIKKVQAAIQTIIDIGLLAVFQLEGTTYVWSRKWQTYQDVRWPRKTSLPMPSDLGGASDETRELFGKHGPQAQKDLGETSEKLPLRVRARSAQAPNTHTNTHTNPQVEALELNEKGAADTPTPEVLTTSTGIQPRWTPPLINGAEQRRHGQHSFCGRVCVTFGQHMDFIRRLGTDDAEASLQAWYPTVMAKYEGRKIGDDIFEFWNNELGEWVGTVTAKAAPAMMGKGEQTKAAARRVLAKIAAQAGGAE